MQITDISPHFICDDLEGLDQYPHFLLSPLIELQSNAAWYSSEKQTTEEHTDSFS